MDAASDAWHVIRPTPAMLPRLYELMGEIFPPDRLLMQRVRDGALTLPNWDHFVLLDGDDIVSHAALVHMQIWWQGRLVPIAGLASVLTAPPYRRRGLARRVVEAALATADQAQKPCVLFTGLPAVYEGHGFRTLPQTFPRARCDAIATASAEFAASPAGLTFDQRTQLDASDLETIIYLYTHASPHHDGKLLREPAYWPFYQTLVNARSDVRFLFCRSADRILGYIRWEHEPESLLITELSAAPDADCVIPALLAHAFAAARAAKLAYVTFALPPDHPAIAVLDRTPVETSPDPTPREHFMLRPGRTAPDLSALRWSLADKF